MPATGLQLPEPQEQDGADSIKNARSAAKYLKLHHGRFCNWPLVFAAYNCGQGLVAAP
jgi:hypothetical protein